MSLDGKVAVVTGGSNGIGKETSLALAREGADIVVNYHSDDEAANRVAEEIKRIGRRTMVIKADVSDCDTVVEMVRKVKSEFGKIDILVNNAGITRDKLLMQMEDKDWLDVINTNLTGVFNCSRAVIISMMRQKSGKIVNISSTSGLTGLPGQVNYSASKGGINAFTKALAKELSPFGINVNAVAPGFIETRMTSRISKEDKDSLFKFIPLKRFGKPQEVAEVVLFLVSDSASYITGQIINIDGGMYM